MVLEVSDSGELILPSELVQAPPHSRLAVERQGENLVFKPLSNDPLARKPEQLTAAETWDGLFAWAERNRTPANIPLETLRRENLYD